MNLESRSPWFQFWFFFGMEFFAYFLIVANTRAFTLGLYGWTALTDCIFSFSNFYFISKVAKTESRAAWAGYTLGGTLGSLASIWLTVHVYGR